MHSNTLYIYNILCIVNLCFSSGVFPTSCKSSILFPLIKKPGLDPEILKNYRPVANLSFISKIIEKAIATQIHDHLINNYIVDNFQSVYKIGHSCETALLRVYNDIVTTIGRGNGVMPVLFDLSAAFDTIDHHDLFCILEKYVVICGNALKLIKSYFSNRTQSVQIDDVLSDFDIYVFVEYIGKLSALIDEVSTSNLILLVDFNVVVNTTFESELVVLCISYKLIISDYITYGRDSGQFTYVSDAHHSTSWLDHIVCSHDIYSKLTLIKIHDKLPSSDH